MLFIHGANEKKEHIEHHCKRYAKFGYITATMDYSELFKQIPNTNIFRILDEIAQCVNTIKNILVYEYNFIGDKLELAVGGFSIGSHYALFNILQFL